MFHNIIEYYRSHFGSRKLLKTIIVILSQFSVIKMMRPVPFRHGFTLGFYNPGFMSPIDKLCQCHEFGNFHQCTIILDDFVASSAESAYQALKFTDSRERKYVALMSPHDAWEYVKSQKIPMSDKDACRNMFKVLEAKFSQNQFLMNKLLQTGDTFLVEHNMKKGIDTRWSNDCDGTGRNLLGLFLMILRGDSEWDSKFNREQGCFTSHANFVTWMTMVQAATDALVRQLSICNQPIPRSPPIPSYQRPRNPTSVQKCARTGCCNVANPHFQFCRKSCGQKCIHLDCMNDRADNGKHQHCGKKCRDGKCGCRR